MTMIHNRFHDPAAPARSVTRLWTGAAAASLMIALSGCSGGAPSAAPPASEPPLAASTQATRPTTTPKADSKSPAPATGSESTSKSPSPASADAGKDPASPPADSESSSAPELDGKAKAYVAEKVAKGGDPNAVIQVGQEICDRLDGIKETDPEAVVSELIMNADGEAADAIASLCGDLKPELARSLRGFPDGQFNVGTPDSKSKDRKVAPGTYVLWNPLEGCQLEVVTAKGSILATHVGESTVTIPSNAGHVVSSGCYSWLPEK